MARSAWGKSAVAAVLAAGFALLGAADASADTRSLKLFNLHTREKVEIVFKRNGRFDQSGLRKLNEFLRDWRKNEPTKMDPRLFDLIWEAYRQSGSHEYINVVCGYRSPATNSMLRSRSKGVAKKSQHMLGKAMDFFIPDVKLKKLREIGLKMQGGGVGYYPTSGSPFVHFDVGNVRHWPKMSRKELIALFPDGKTLHVPSDGKPLPGFNQALAAYQARKKSGDVAIASLASGKSSSSSSRSGGLLAALFGGGGGADDEEDSAGASVASAADDAEAAPPAKQATKVEAAPPLALEAVEPPPPAIVAALPPRDVPLPDSAPRPSVDVGETSTAGLYGTPDQPASEPVAEVALNIPLPTSRPSYSPPEELAEDAQEAVMAAAAAADPDAPLPGDRPEEPADVIAPLIAMDENDEAEQDADAYTVASLPQVVPVATDTAFPTAPDELLPAAKSPDEELMAYATPRSALVARKPGTDATAAAITTVKTTAKSARPTRKDLKKSARQPVVVAAQPVDARWALDSAYVAENSKSAPAPSFANSMVRNAPAEVYTTGFQQGTQVADARRFSGKAVQFLSVAKFRTN